MNIQHIATRSLEECIVETLKLSSEGYSFVEGSANHFINGLFTLDMFMVVPDDKSEEINTNKLKPKKMSA